jgi:predicted phage baseplate assembly protein
VKFDFLPELPKSDLDDRTFNDLVEECLLRIPRYCPEWTNHNPGDPGITLIELFAWLTDQMLMRFNQVPRRNYVAFLELLGIRLQPPAPAWCELTFYLTKSATRSNYNSLCHGSGNRANRNSTINYF